MVVIAIALGSSHTCAIATGGGVKCWGRNEFGQLGIGSTTDQYSPVDVAGAEGAPFCAHAAEVARRSASSG